MACCDARGPPGGLRKEKFLNCQYHVGFLDQDINGSVMNSPIANVLQASLSKGTDDAPTVRNRRGRRSLHRWHLPKQERERTFPPLLNATSTLYMKNHLPPSDQQMETIRGLRCLFDWEDAIAWQQEVGLDSSGLWLRLRLELCPVTVHFSSDVTSITKSKKCGSLALPL